MEYTEEEKKAIENIKEDFYGYYIGTRYMECNSNDIEIVLNLIEKQQKEIEKKDKIIDKMAKQIENYDNQLNISYFKNIEDIKDFYEDIVNHKELLGE